MGSVRASPSALLPKEIKIRMYFKRPVRLPMWIAAISICLLAALGITAIVRSIPLSYASIPTQNAPSKGRTAPAPSEGVTAEELLPPLAAARATEKRSTRVSCPGCGVIESMRQTEPPESMDRQGALTVKGPETNPGGASGGVIAGGSAARKSYEFTVRFRDRSTMIFSEASPRAWGLGTPVMVIGSLNSTNH
jgi:hypothetical protein